uniref:Tr-type G domain-containing protein n=1 Tax=Caenorhabditis tropicalis TaxID=1561998 RepID=A0A1I7TXG3_9PELO
MCSIPSTSSSSLNVGILGHVDSGKTTLTRRIAEMGSTSAFDAASGIRKNTLDLGFSTMTSSSGRRLALIDCPGHSGLIRAVLAASTVFDMAIVVIDAIAGIQPQTAEHLFLVSKFCPSRLIIVLSKCDLAAEKNEKIIEETKRKIRKGLKAMHVDSEAPIVEMSLIDGVFKTEMLETLKSAIESRVFEPRRDAEGPLLIAIDHCFSVKGQGTVLTGTVLRGVLRLNSEIELSSLSERRRIKTLESWKQRVDDVASGERAAFLVSPSFDERRFSRCLSGAPGTLKSTKSVLATVDPIPFFRKSIASKSRCHVAVAFETLMAECVFLRDADTKFEQLDGLLAPCQITTSSGPIGTIEGAFGKSGKFRVTFHEKIDGLVKEKEEISLSMKKYHGDNRLVSYIPDL